MIFGFLRDRLQAFCDRIDAEQRAEEEVFEARVSARVADELRWARAKEAAAPKPAPVAEAPSVERRIQIAVAEQAMTDSRMIGELQIRASKAESAVMNARAKAKTATALLERLRAMTAGFPMPGEPTRDLAPNLRELAFSRLSGARELLAEVDGFVRGMKDYR